MVGAKKTGTVNSTEDISLGPAAGSRVSSWLVQLEADGSWSGTCTPKGAAQDSNNTLINLGFKDMNTSAVSTTAPTTDALILIDSSGVDVVLSFSRSAGTMTYTAIPLVG